MMSADDQNDRPAWLPERLPIEDPDAGLYIHQHLTPVTVISTPAPVDPHKVELPEPELRYLVDAAHFMAVQKERDDLRRVAGLIGAWMLTADRRDSDLRRLLASVGINDTLARSLAGIVEQVKNGSL